MMRYFGKTYGYAVPDASITYETDCQMNIDAAVLSKVSPMCMQGKRDAEAKQIFTDQTKQLIAEIEACLKRHNKNFLLCDKLTIADFSKAGLIFTHWRNPNHMFSTDFTGIAQQLLADNKYVSAYVDRLEQALAKVLKERPPRPM